MELQFEKQMLDCLMPTACQVRGSEQTQEIRLSDAMPDIGRVIAAWGQPLLRSKEWRGNGMVISGGVMAWVLYAPEDGSEPQTVETWIPFQLKWDFPEAARDGFMTADCLLSAVDARSVSARKLIVRAAVSAMGQALEPTQVELYLPNAPDASVQLLRQTYPMRLMREAGEKQFALEEELVLPPGAPAVAKLIRYCLQPAITEQKLLGSRALFRGNALAHGLYRTESGEVKTFTQEVGFSQYADLDREYSADGEVQVIPAVTGLELELGESGRLMLKAGLTCQYVVTDLTMVEVAEDAYGLGREVKPRLASLELPAVLDEWQETLHLDRHQSLDAEQILDTAFLCAHPRLRREGDRIAVELEGGFQLLCISPEGTLQGKYLNWETSMPLGADEHSRIMAWLHPEGNPVAICGSGNVDLRAEARVRAITVAEEGIPMMTGLDVGELQPPDSKAPSLILRRAGREKLWAIAKKCGSTVDAITRANGLTGEPDGERMLLIPVR